MALRRGFLILLLLCAGPALAAGLLDDLRELGGGARAARHFLPPDQAFRFAWEPAPGALTLLFEIAPGYYLYRDKLGVEAPAGGASVGALGLPESEPKDDPEFGRVQIYRDSLQITAPLLFESREPVSLRVTWQGCAEDGICYPPVKRELTLDPALFGATPAKASLEPRIAPEEAPVLGETERMAAELAQRSLAATLLWFFLAGLALSLTPCVFPMVPILTGIIVGQHQPLSIARSFSLSLAYVLAMAATYAAAGLAAGLFGRNLQAVFQHPAVLVAFSALFVVLALSMFGFFHLQLPAFIQGRLEATSRRQRSGSLLGVGVMGMLSAVIVGPCVAPPLAAALIYLGHQGSPLVGGLALFSLGLGMGVPLLVLGASAGRLLPPAGAWMERVKQSFGVVFLALAIWFLERLLPAPATLALWAALAIGSAIYLGALEPLADAATGWQRFWKGIGLTLLCYGVVLLVGAAAGASDPLRPLAPLTAPRQAFAGTPETVFAPIRGESGLTAMLAAARARGQPALLDFYADWCIECKRLERNTFADAEVRRQLAGVVLMRADVTAANPEDQALLARFDLHGPPAVLFFDPQGQERRGDRLIGYLAPAEFRALAARALAASAP